ncbi:PA2779 family protein [Parahaliea mediterranea]|uniref:PA2779 family protein n=1 Tax=Parahaliea mediterranea TaxID=651086 RepID=A0A939DC40_9GAMM|nr:PA2779 family protein [Parahaliea mediterranea]MBN7795455.1 PA2779 family protein [Parahaliea mediterranea]
MITSRAVMLVHALVLVCATTFSSAQAAVFSTADYLSQADHGTHLARVEAALARDDVRQQLVALGVSPAQAEARIAALSPAELQQLNARMDEMPAGGILGLIGAVFIVLLILEIVGVTDVFSKI